MTLFFNRSDLALAFRLMRKQPVLAFTAFLALTTGIGMAATGFTFLEAGVWGQLPFAGGDRFVLVDAFEDPETRRASIEADRFTRLKTASTNLVHLGALDGGAENLLLSSGEVVIVSTTRITPDSFGVLPYAPVLGRSLQPPDAAAGAVPVAVIRESLWRRHFSAAPGVLGSTANLSGVHRTIVGVMPDGLEFPNSPEAWIPLAATGSDASWSSVRVFGVLRERGTERLVTEQLQAASRQFEAERPDLPKLRLEVLPFIDALSRGLGVLAAGVVAVLLLVLIVIAANVANLVLARTLARSHELAVRTALGATRGRLVGQIVTEVLVIGTAAAIVGLTASQTALRWIQATVTDMPFWVDLTASPRTMAFVVGATLLATAIGGVLPALRVTRRNTSAALATTSRSISTGFGRTGSAMIALQITLSIALLNAALVMARGVAGYMDGGISPSLPILTARVVIDDEAYAAGRHLEIVERLQRIRGVEFAGISTSLPRLSPPVMMASVRDSASSTASVPRSAPVVAIAGGFIETLGARPTTGRLFEPNDFQASVRPVAIVNEPFVAKFLSGANPIGTLVRVRDADDADDQAPWREIVGVVPDLGLSAGDELLAAGVYVPVRTENVFHVSLAGRGDQLEWTRSLKTELAQLNPRIFVSQVMPLEQVGIEDRAVFAGIGAALTAIGGLSLLLSVMGVYAMLSFSVTERSKEIAIRSALGATRARVLRTVLGGSAVPLTIGAILGPLLGSVLIAGRGIFAFRLPADGGPWAAPLLCLLMLGAGLLASWIPARLALRASTADALRA